MSEADERDVRRMMRSNAQPILDRCHKVYCPFCQSLEGQWCRTRTNQLTYPHLKRRRWALVRETRSRERE